MAFKILKVNFMGTLNDLGIDENRLVGIVKKHDKSMKWMYQNMENIQKLYAGQFIAILNNEIVGTGIDRRELFKKLKQKYTDDESDEIFIDFINPKGYILIL